jgi:hypothetical protein
MYYNFLSPLREEAKRSTVSIAGKGFSNGFVL